MIQTVNISHKLSARRMGKLRFAFALVLILLAGLWLVFEDVTQSDSSMTAQPAQAGESRRSPALRGQEAIDHLKQEGAYDSLQQAMASIGYEAKWETSPKLQNIGAAYELRNAANNLLAYVNEDGLEVIALNERAKPWRLGMKLTGYGYGASLSSVSSGEITAKGNRISVRKSAIRNPQSTIEEWFVNTSRGIEHGYDIPSPPGKKRAGEALRLQFEVSGNLRAQVDASGSSAALTRAEDGVLLSYAKLFVTDVKGRVVNARMKLEPEALIIEVEDAGGQYPLTIDPLLRQMTNLAPLGATADDQYGISVAISGDTAVVGAYLSDNLGVSAHGLVYVFVRSRATWTQQQVLSASDRGPGDGLGYSVAISGDTIVAGAWGDFDHTGGEGSAYVFVRSGTVWAEQAKLVAADGAGGRFGWSVAVSGDTAVVGSYTNNSAYVYVRSGATWTQQQRLTASDGMSGDEIGRSVAISGDTIVLGAPDYDGDVYPRHGSAYVFVRNQTTWTQQQKLSASDSPPADAFGISVAISGNTVVVGDNQDDVGNNSDQGSAYVFTRTGVNWAQQAKLVAADGAAGDNLGASAAISGDTVVVGANGDDVSSGNQGSAYVFVRSGTTWTQQQQLTAIGAAADDHFGRSVAISVDTVVVGAPFYDEGPLTNRGSAYLYVCNWNQQAQLTAADGAADDFLGNSIAVSGYTIVVGASNDDVGFTDQGSAYVFARNGTGWSQQARLTAANGAADDRFGNSVAISGETIVIGAPRDDVGGNLDQGSAYVFVRSGTIWAQQQQLTASDGAADDHFGVSVGISGDTIVVGADSDDIVANADQGSAYVFTRSGVNWAEQIKLIATDGAADDFFGRSVAVSGEDIVVGAYFDDVSLTNQGSAYVFVRSGLSWAEQAKLVAAEGESDDHFGGSVAISGDTAVAGADSDDVGANADQGSAYVFTRSGVSWAQQAKLLAADAAATDFFGSSVAIGGDTIVVGAPSDNNGVFVSRGSAYVFVRSGAAWFEQQQLAAVGGRTGDLFGSSVAVSGDTIAVGATGDDAGLSNQGSAYAFYMGCNTAPTIAASSQSRQKGSPATTATIAQVLDSEDPIGYLSVTVASAPAGVLISSISNNNGLITASIAASCSASLDNHFVTLRVQDSDGAVGSVQLIVNVTSNSAPNIGIYPNNPVAVLGTTTLTPNLIPSDNGSIVTFSATSPTYTGISSVDLDTGVVTLTNARPAGSHVFTVTAIDNCGITTTSGFTLTVICETITVNPPTIPGGTAGEAYSQTFTQTGGLGAVTFFLSGALPTGLSFTGDTLLGMPTQVGTFPITVTAIDQNNCVGSRNYSLTITSPMLVWNGATSGDWHTASNWTPNAVPVSYHDVSIPTSGVVNQPVIANASAAINAMTLQAGRVLTINDSRQLVARGNINSSGQITGNGNLRVAGPTFTQNGSVSVSSVEFAGGVHMLTGGGAFASGIMTVLNGASVTLISNHSVSVIVINNGGLVDAGNQTLTLTGAGTAIFNSGTFIANGSAIVYQGQVAQVVTPNIGYANLTVNNPAGVSLAGDTTVEGVLNLQKDLSTGSFKLIMPAAGTSTGPGDVTGNVQRTGFVSGGASLSFGNFLNTIRITSGTVPSDVTMNLAKNPPFGFSNTVSRSYAITANGGSEFSATLRLRYIDAEAAGLDESTFELWRNAGASWVSPAGAANRNTTENWVEETGISQFSRWTISGPPGPVCGVLTPNSKFFGVQGGDGSIVLSALASCSWIASSNASWIELTSSVGGAGSDIVNFIVRDNFSPIPRQGTLTIAGQQFTIVQDSEAAPDCTYAISPSFATFNGNGGTGSVDIFTEERCAWQAVSNASWIAINSTCCGIGNGSVSYLVGANPGSTGRAGTITVAGKTSWSSKRDREHTAGIAAAEML